LIYLLVALVTELLFDLLVLPFRRVGSEKHRSTKQRRVKVLAVFETLLALGMSAVIKYNLFASFYFMAYVYRTYQATTNLLYLIVALISLAVCGSALLYRVVCFFTVYISFLSGSRSNKRALSANHQPVAAFSQLCYLADLLSPNYLLSFMLFRDKKICCCRGDPLFIFVTLQLAVQNLPQIALLFIFMSQ